MNRINVLIPRWLNFVDVFPSGGKSKEPAWHGWASKSVTSADRNNPSPAIQEAVAAIIKRFPLSN